MNPKELRLAQMDAMLQDAASHSLPQRPQAGWLRAIREALGMTSAALAARLEITASGVRKLEQAEATDAITLGTLRRVAEARDCELQYTLVPCWPWNPHSSAERLRKSMAQRYSLEPPQSCQLSSRRASSSFMVLSSEIRWSIEVILAAMLSLSSEQLQTPERRTSRILANSGIDTSIALRARMIANSARFPSSNKRYPPAERSLGWSRPSSQ